MLSGATNEPPRREGPRGGFVRGERVEPEPGLREKIRAAVDAWEWTVDRDLLAPRK